MSLTYPRDCIRCGETHQTPEEAAPCSAANRGEAAKANMTRVREEIATGQRKRKMSVMSKRDQVELECTNLRLDIEQADMQIRNQGRANLTLMAENRRLIADRNLLAHRLHCPQCREVDPTKPGEEPDEHVCSVAAELVQTYAVASQLAREAVQKESLNTEIVHGRRKSKYARASQKNKLDAYLYKQGKKRNEDRDIDESMPIKRKGAYA